MLYIILILIFLFIFFLIVIFFWFYDFSLFFSKFFCFSNVEKKLSTLDPDSIEFKNQLCKEVFDQYLIRYPKSMQQAVEFTKTDIYRMLDNYDLVDIRQFFRAPMQIFDFLEKIAMYNYDPFLASALSLRLPDLFNLTQVLTFHYESYTVLLMKYEKNTDISLVKPPIPSLRVDSEFERTIEILNNYNNEFIVDVFTSLPSNCFCIFLMFFILIFSALLLKRIQHFKSYGKFFMVK